MASVAGIGNVAEILESACARNLPVELHRETAAAMQVAKTRLLGIDDKHLYLDSPQAIGKPVQFGKGTVLTVYLSAEDGWLMFRSRVTITDCAIQLNNSKRVLGLAVTRPTKLTQGQRREDYRVSLACVTPIEADLHEASPADPNCCPLDAERFAGRLVDLSAGGLALRVETSQRRSFRINELLFISFTLPDGQGEMTLLVEVRHTRPILSGQATRVGLKYLSWNPLSTRRNVRRLLRFLADVQRRGMRSKS